jgi:hypothetical protein
VVVDEANVPGSQSAQCAAPKPSFMESGVMLPAEHSLQYMLLTSRLSAPTAEAAVVVA